jgi:hypothetical protein
VINAYLDGAAASGGVLLDRDTFVDTPARFRLALAGLPRERPDVLDAATWQEIGHITDDEDLDTEKIVDVLTDHPPAANLTAV